MKELIVVGQSKVGNAEIKTVNARDLHVFLGAKKDFSDWIKERIKKYDFIEGVDFIKFPRLGESNSKQLIDYHLSIDMAKELSMVERNEKGKQARLYFLECEKVALTPQPAFTLPTNYKEALLQLVDQVEKTEQLQITLQEKQAQIEAAKPDLEAFSRLAKSEGSFNLTSSAKLLCIKPSTLTDYLSSNKWIYKRAGSKHWVAYQHRLEQGHLRHKTFNYIDSLGYTQSGEQVMVTTRGLTHLGEIFANQPRQHVSGDKSNPKQQTFIQ